jgi:glycerophosphoryl diester phosphodiesterase
MRFSLLLAPALRVGEDELPSNTLYAIKRSVKAGADMLELGVMTARPIAFEQMRAGHAAPEAGG